MGIEYPLPFPESRELDSKAGICNRPLPVVFKQTKTVNLSFVEICITNFWYSFCGSRLSSDLPLRVLLIVGWLVQMIPIENMSMKKLALCEQKGKISRWRRSHDEWLLQFKWRWQKPWKLSHLIRTSDQIRNSDETLKGQDLPLRLGSTSWPSLNTGVFYSSVYRVQIQWQHPKRASNLNDDGFTNDMTWDIQSCWKFHCEKV